MQDATEGSGTIHNTGCVYCDHITGLMTGIKYPKDTGNTVQQWKPGGVKDVGKCQKQTSTTTTGVDVDGLTIQQSTTSEGTVCPATFGIYGQGQYHFSTKWDGQGNGPNNGADHTWASDADYNESGAPKFAGVYDYTWYTTT